MSYENVTNRVASALQVASSKDISARHRAGYMAALSNCTPIGQDSAFAALVAVPDEFPDVVIKVCTNPKDGFILYALLCLSGEIHGENYLTVHSATRVNGAWIFVLERLEERASFDRVPLYLEEAVRKRLCSVKSKYCGEQLLDMHRGNWMLRRGVHVCIDPFSGSEFQLDGNIPVPQYTAPEYTIASTGAGRFRVEAAVPRGLFIDEVPAPHHRFIYKPKHAKRIGLAKPVGRVPAFIEDERDF